MTRIRPLSIDELPESQQQSLQLAEELMGFVSNDSLVMARNPLLMDAFGQLVRAVYSPGAVDGGLKRLIGLVVSSVAGCRYCMSHTAYTSQRHGIDEKKVAAVWEFETSEFFDDAEKAALRVALHAGQHPNAVTDPMFEELAQHYDDDAQLEIVAVISLFGFLNRWNQTLATDIEDLPAAALLDAER